MCRKGKYSLVFKCEFVDIFVITLFNIAEQIILFCCSLVKRAYLAKYRSKTSSL